MAAVLNPPAVSKEMPLTISFAEAWGTVVKAESFIQSECKEKNEQGFSILRKDRHILQCIHLFV